MMMMIREEEEEEEEEKKKKKVEEIYLDEAVQEVSTARMALTKCGGMGVASMAATVGRSVRAIGGGGVCRGVCV